MQDPSALIGTGELAGRLGDPKLRIYDCTTYLDRLPPGSVRPYNAVSGLATYIPGAAYLDLQGEFSRSDTDLHFMMPQADDLAEAFGRHGIGSDSRVVLYSIGTMMWATRFWWMLKSLGFDNAAVLNGGFDKWRAEGRPTESGATQSYAPQHFRAAPRAGYFVGSDDVLAVLDRPGTVLVNALSPDAHQGLSPSSYGRSGRIPGSVNVYGPTLARDDSGEFVEWEEAEQIFADRGVTREKRVIAYCGGGISATLDLFALWQLGYSDLSLYDGSMGEWATDEKLPIETDQG